MSERAQYQIIPTPAPQQAIVEGWEYEVRPITTVPKRPFERVLAAIRRYKWVVLGVFLASIGVGFAATRFVTPEYEVNATIWINSANAGSDRAGPIRTGELLGSAAWIDLLKSFRIADAVVRKLRLYVRPVNPADSVMLRDFMVADKFVPGLYDLRIEPDTKTWTLGTKEAPQLDHGAATDSIGRKLGFRWVAPPTVFEGSGEKTFSFVVTTPRQSAIGLTSRLHPRLPEGSSFLLLTLNDSDPKNAQRILNTWANEFVAIAGDLKKRNVVQFASTLDGQLAFAERSLRDAERALEDFRVNTITLPAEGGPVAAGVEVTRDPALKSFFDQKVQYDDLRNDREALEKVIAGAQSGSVPWETALLIPSVASSPGAEALRQTFTQLQTKRAELATKLQTYTEQHPEVRALRATINQLERQTLPSLASQMLTQLRQREGEYDRRINVASSELKAIPSRTIEEMRLRRAVSVSEELYTTLKSRYSEAQLAEASTTPDISVLDSAVAPLYPSRNTAPRLLMISILTGLAVAVALAMLLDALDGRVRYPEQVTDDLGLSIAGAVPRFPKGGANANSPEQMSQLVESIRTIRMHISQAAGVPCSIAVSSPSPGDGKSFISANLAMSFAEAGFRTVLVDADTRRGKLHETFSLPNSLGLTDYLLGLTDLESVKRATGNELLTVITRGKQNPKSPELLASAALPALADQLRNNYTVVVFDTPPLSAGIDAYAIASAAHNLLVVLRVGETNRRLAAAKVKLVDRLPVRLVGAVLNCVKLTAEFDTYRYAYGYGVDEEKSSVVAVARR